MHLPPRSKPSRVSRLRWTALAVVALLALVVDRGRQALASQAAPAAGISPVLCGTIDAVGGDVQVLDSGRSVLLTALSGSGLPCGAWISVGAGKSWISIRHRDGVTLHASAGTFMALGPVEQVILFRGNVFGRAEGGTPELQVLTSNARSRIPMGMAVVIYNQGEEETQLVSLEGTARIENRFAPEGVMEVKEGEASSLNFKLLRTVPSAPRAVASADLREKLKSFPIDDRIHSLAVRAAFQRGERKFAATFDQEAKQQAEFANRAPATVAAEMIEKEREAATERMLMGKLAEKVTGGVPGGAHLLSPSGSKRVPASAVVKEIELSESTLKARKVKAEQAERKRLMRELSRLKADDSP